MKMIANLLSIGVIFTLLGCGTSLATKEIPAPSSSTMVTGSVHFPMSTKNQPKISMDEFTQIKNGMTYEQVTEIVGSPGEMIAQTGTPGDQFHTETYNFKGDRNSILYGSFAQLTFQDGKLNTKAQKGMLRPIK